MRRPPEYPRDTDRVTRAALRRLLTVLAICLVAACSGGGPVRPDSEQQPSASASAEASTGRAAPGTGSGDRAAASPPAGPVAGSATQAHPPVGGTTVEISAVGDVIMGSTPELPPDDGRHLFDAVADRLTGDVVLANLDQALTDVTTSEKCGGDSSGCYAFRTPPSYAEVLGTAGFTVINLANNHSHDFGDSGLRDTQTALTAAGLQYTGMPGQITLQEVDGLHVAIVGFAPYRWAQSLLDIPAAQQLVSQAAAQADLVLVTIHAGAEGRDRGHVRPGNEIFLGEDRGDPVAFSHAVIDAGADAVLGAGPHVLRGMEWYRGRLIAYSLGNFTGYRTLSNDGPAGIGGIVTFRLTPAGTWQGGRLVSTVMVDPGAAQIDPEQQALQSVRDLSVADFGGCGVDISPAGELGAPTC